MNITNAYQEQIACTADKYFASFPSIESLSDFFKKELELKQNINFTTLKEKVKKSLESNVCDIFNDHKITFIVFLKKQKIKVYVTSLLKGESYNLYRVANLQKKKIKVLKSQGDLLSRQNDPRKIEKELSILNTINLSLKKFGKISKVVLPTCVAFKMPKMDGDYFDNFKLIHALSIKDKLKAFNSILQDFLSLNENQWIVGDIKLDNILIKQIDGQLHLSLCDFGGCWNKNDIKDLKSDRFFPFETTTTSILLSDVAVMEKYYQHPENNKFDLPDFFEKMDIFMLGIAFFEFLTAQSPYGFTKYNKTLFLDPEQLNVNNLKDLNINEKIAAIITAMIYPSYEERCSINEIQQLVSLIQKE